MAQITNRYDLEPYESIPYVWVLDSSFNRLNIIESYTSLIWSRRFYETGDFELYIEATEENLNLLRIGNHVARTDYPDEVYRIEKVEITTSGEDGDFITASGRDLRCIIYQRCTQFQWTFNSTKEDERQSIDRLVNQLIYENFINTTSYKAVTTDETDAETGEVTTTNTGGVDFTVYNNPARQMPSYFQIGSIPDLEIYVESITVDIDNIGDILETLSERYGFGWRVRFARDRNGKPQLRFDVYKGADHSQDIVFAEKFNNLIDATYTYDRTDYFNCGRVVDKDNDIDISIGDATGMDRYEHKMDTADLDIDCADDVSFENVADTFGWLWNGGKIMFDYDDDHTGWGLFGNTYRKLSGYKVWFEGYDFPLYGDVYYENKIKAAYPMGSEVTVSGINYWRVTDPIYLEPHHHEDDWYHGWDCTSIETNSDGEIECVLERNGGWGKYPDFEKVEPQKPLWNSETRTFDRTKADPHQKWLRTVTFDIPQTIKESMMIENAYAAMEVYMKDEEFEGNVETRSLYRYRKDYDIGDTVHIITDVGITEDVVITEAVETFDSDGYTVEVGFKK